MIDIYGQDPIPTLTDAVALGCGSSVGYSHKLSVRSDEPGAIHSMRERGCSDEFARMVRRASVVLDEAVINYVPKPVYVEPGYVLCQREHASSRPRRKRFLRESLRIGFGNYSTLQGYGRDQHNRLWSVVADGGVFTTACEYNAETEAIDFKNHWGRVVKSMPAGCR